MTTAEIESPTQEVVEKEASGLVPQALSVKVVDKETYELADNFRRQIKQARGAWSRIMEPICDSAHKAWKTATGKRGDVDKPMEEAERHLNREMADYNDREQKRLEGLRRAEEERRRKEEETRLLEEAARKEEEGREAAARAAREREESETLRSQGRDAEADMKSESAQVSAREAETSQAQAEAIIETPVITAPVRIQAAVPKVAGVSYRDNWKGECFDLKALVKAIAEGKAPLSLVMANATVVNQTAKALKAEFQVPGVKVWNEKVLMDRGAN